LVSPSVWLKVMLSDLAKPSAMLSATPLVLRSAMSPVTNSVLEMVPVMALASARIPRQ
jgi:hypothetical protein